jgi:putative hydrolase of the HAD superfamily
MKKLSNIRAVGFDVDGTLYKHSTESTIAISKIVIQKAAELLGRDDDEFAQEYLERREKYRGNTLTLNSFGLDGEAIFQAVIDQFPVENYVKEDKQLQKLIKGLKKHYRLFIISNGTKRHVERKLKVLGLTLSEFDPVICCYEHHWAKPEPAPFLLAIESLKVNPEEIVYIGDREDLDIEAAKTMGMRTIYVRS